MDSPYKTPPIVEVIRVMNEQFGTGLIHGMTGATPQEITSWVQGGMPNVVKEATLRTAYLVFLMLCEVEDPLVARRMILGEPIFMALSEGRRRDAIDLASAHINREFG